MESYFGLLKYVHLAYSCVEKMEGLMEFVLEKHWESMMGAKRGFQTRIEKVFLKGIVRAH